MPRAFRFLHTGDLHLDTPFAGLSGSAPDAIAARLRDATLKAWDRIVNLAIERDVDFVVVAGDIYEAETRTLRGQFAFADGLARLDARGIPAAIVHGNHDPLSGWEASVTWPASAHRFGAMVEAHPITKDGEELARVYGISYAQKAETRDLASMFHRDADASFAIGLLHGTIGIHDRHVNYAPTTEDVLVASGMDYWALGHIHARRIVRAAKPTVVYPGNPQGRDPGEAQAKGIAIVTVDAAGTPTVELVDTDVVRWVILRIDCGPIPTMSDLRTAIATALADARQAAGRSIVARVELTGYTPLHDELVRTTVAAQLLANLREGFPPDAPEFAWLEAIRDETRSDREAAYARGADFIAELDALVTTTSGADVVPGHDALDLDALAGELYRDHRVVKAFGEDGIEPPDLLESLAEARSLVLDRLRSTGGTA